MFQLRDMTQEEAGKGVEVSELSFEAAVLSDLVLQLFCHSHSFWLVQQTCLTATDIENRPPRSVHKLKATKHNSVFAALDTCKLSNCCRTRLGVYFVTNPYSGHLAATSSVSGKKRIAVTLLYPLSHHLLKHLSANPRMQNARLSLEPSQLE